VIISFGDKETEELWRTEKSKRHSNFSRIAMRKLLQLHAAERLRICFVWTKQGPAEVMICDYH
jgi:plasmid maintenance system killer protein